jgi:hypothetical protein
MPLLPWGALVAEALRCHLLLTKVQSCGTSDP